MIQPFKRTKVYEAVVEQMLKLFRDGALKAGDRMPSERALAVEMNVSRTSIREAFRALESMGYTETRVGDGTFVRKFSLDTLVQPASLRMLQNDQGLIREFIEVRLTLETSGATLAAKRITAQQLEELEDILREMEKDIENGGTGHEQDREFHLHLARSAGNESLNTVFSACRGMLDRTSRMIMQIPEQPRKALEGHREILANIRKKNGTGAAEAMQKHLKQIYGYLETLNA